MLYRLCFWLCHILGCVCVVYNHNWKTVLTQYPSDCFTLKMCYILYTGATSSIFVCVVFVFIDCVISNSCDIRNYWLCYIQNIHPWFRSWYKIKTVLRVSKHLRVLTDVPSRDLFLVWGLCAHILLKNNKYFSFVFISFLQSILEKWFIPPQIKHPQNPIGNRLM